MPWEDASPHWPCMRPPGPNRGAPHSETGCGEQLRGALCCLACAGRSMLDASSAEAGKAWLQLMMAACVLSTCRVLFWVS